MTDRQRDIREQGYVDGRKAVWLRLLDQCLGELGVTDTAAGQAAWVSERAEVVALLRQLCAEYGDQEWEDTLHLSDVIEKHLMRHLLRGK